MKIVSDSASNIRTCDSKFVSIPLKILISKEYVDDENLDTLEMINDLKTATFKTSTSCPNVQEFEDACADDDEVFIFTISSNLSGSYNAARLAAEELTNKKVTVIDSLSAGPEIGLLILKCDELIKQGLSYEAVKEQLLDYQKHTGCIFGLENINNLANNGRVSPILAKAIGLLGIRLIGKASDQGTIEVISKAKGKVKTIRALAESLEKNGYTGGKVRIDHVFNEESATKLKEALLAKYPNADIQINPCFGLCSFYAEIGGLMVGFEH